MKSITLSLLSLVLLGASAPLYSQEIRGSIVGNVTDPSGAAVPLAHITVRNEGTGIASVTTTGASGTYTVPDLLAGTYTVIAVKEGFKTYQATGVRLLSSQTARQDVVLQVGGTTQTINVAAEAHLVQTDSPTVGGTLEARELSDLPSITQSTDYIMSLVPGMSVAIPFGNSNPDIGGAPYTGSSNWTVNGISTNNPGQGGGGNVTYVGSDEMIAQANLPSIGTLQEFKVESSVVGAEYRSQTAITMVTKQGTNQFHGQVYEYNENKALSANSFDLNKYNETQYPFNRNQFGAGVGGPILRDKLFFFVNYDGIREVHTLPVTANFPTAAMRNGDFSTLCMSWSQGLCTDPNGQQLYNPLTGQPFLNNQIPQTMITSQARTLSDSMPLPNVLTVAPGSTYLPGSPFGAPDWAGAIPLRFGTNNAQMRLDAQLGSKDSVVAFATMSKGAPWFYSYACCPNYGSWTDHGYNWYNFSGTETHTFGPRTVNEFRLGWVVARTRAFGQNLGFEPWSVFPQMPANQDRGLPQIYMSGYDGYSNWGGTLGDVGNALGLQNTLDWVDNLTLVRGRHTIKTGFEESGYKESDYCFFICVAPLGSFNTSGQWTGNRGWSGIYPQSPGNAYADFLVGYVDSSSYSSPNNQRFYGREWDFYVQDTFKASPRLTLNFGVRYMYQKPWWFKDHNATFWDPPTNHLVIQQNSNTVTVPPGADPGAFKAYPFITTQQLGAPLNYFRDDKNNWAPRVGFAYRPFSNNKTVIRGGWGVYYAFNAGWNGPLQALQNIPWIRSAAFNTQLGSTPYPYFPDITFSNPYPADLVAGEAANPTISVMDRNEPNPVSQQWNLTVERQVKESWGLRASYLGAQGHHLEFFNSNIDIPQVQQPHVPNQLQLPYQPWSAVRWTDYRGTSNFHSLQLEAQKRFSHGLMLRMEFDWNRFLTNVQTDREAGGAPPQNPWNMRAEYTNEEFNYRNKFLIYYIYELPVGRGRKWLSNTNKFVDGVLGGWQVSGVTQYHTGYPISPSFENNGSTCSATPPTDCIGWFATYPDRAAGVRLYAGQQSGHDTVNGVLWFNPKAYLPPKPWTFGNASPYSIFGPGFGQWDLSVMKSFKLPKGEANHLEFKMDFFNLPNHYSLGNPSTGIADARDGGTPDPSSGKIYGGNDSYFPRLIQIGLRLIF
jgi:hypothetical protein